jgi:hypothetical protein
MFRVYVLTLGCAMGARIYTMRFSLKSFKRFQLMIYFGNTAMFIYDQMLSAVSGYTLDTHEIFMLALMFYSLLSILDEAGRNLPDI